MSRKDPRVDPGLKQKILQTLEELHAAQAAEHVDAMADTYSETGFRPRKRMRPYFASQVQAGVYRSQRADLSRCEVFVHGNTALVRPVTYTTPKGKRHASFHLRNEQEDRWLIIESNRSASLDAAIFTPELLGNAARLVGERSMLWVRRIEAPVERVWPIISTKEGLDQWWITRDVEIDLKPGVSSSTTGTTRCVTSGRWSSSTSGPPMKRALRITCCASRSSRMEMRRSSPSSTPSRALIAP